MPRLHLNRALSKKGICSRAQASQMIRRGQIQVNGRIVRDPWFWVELDLDHIQLGKTTAKSSDSLFKAAAKVYLLLNKPRGVITTRSDEYRRKTVYDLLPARYRRSWLFPVGRLDMESEGLLFLTNDGVWAERLTSPWCHIPKTYHVLLDRLPNPSAWEIMQQGMRLGQQRLLPVKVTPQSGRWFKIVLIEGKNRQIRRMFQACGCKVKRLIRVAIGQVDLGPLPVGHLRALSSTEMACLAEPGPKQRD